MLRYLIFSIPFALGTLFVSADTIQLYLPREVTPAQKQFAVRTAMEAVEDAGHKLMLRTLKSHNIPAEGYYLEQGENKLMISAADGSGAIYAMLDLVDYLKTGGELSTVPEGLKVPRFEFRAIKFNLPWAAYRTGPSIEQHQETCRDLDFWTAFLDMMVENRFNTLSLWSLHPWHLMVRTPEYPEMSALTDKELAEWQAFWTDLFALAEERGIETYLVNWNMYVSPAFSKAHGNIAEWSQSWDFFGNGTDDELVIDYTRATIREVLRQYPGLTGLGITLGERMGGMSPDERRAWLEKTVLAGVRDAGRPTKFLYRAPLSADQDSGGTTDIDNDRATRAQVESLGEPFEQPAYVEFKFNWSHGHSSPGLHLVHGGQLSDAYFDPEPEAYKAVWTVRNEDFHQLRWGEPDFVREFIKQNGQPHTGGAIIGSEVFIPAMDTLSRDGAHKTWTWQFERQWLFYAVWGRLLYEDDTPDMVFIRMLEERFPGCDGEKLLAAWKIASSVPLRMASFHRGSIDRSLYTEAFGHWREGGEQIELFDINSFITHPVLDPAYINIRDFVRGTREQRQDKITPFHLVKGLLDDSVAIGKLLGELRTGVSEESPLAAELADIEAWGHYAQYFANKIRAGVALESARHRNSRLHYTQARAGLKRALEHWKHYAEAAARYNHESFRFHTRQPMSLTAMIPQVEKDVALVDEFYPRGPAWQTMECNGEPHARHEAAFIECNGKLYLLGGRGIKPVDQLDPATGEWAALAPPPIELHHFQAIERDGKIWVIGAMTGPYPDEQPVPNVYIFDPSANEWTVGPEIPEARRRGGAGVVQADGKIYIVGGIRRGHMGGFVPWLDRWDPETDTWEVLPDAPNPRDHFQAVVIDGSIYAAGGRRTSGETNETFSLTVPEVDAYNIADASWSTVGTLPTPRAGTSSFAYKGFLVVAGGESTAHIPAHREVEAFNPETGVWIDWPGLRRGRHGTGLALVKDRLYTCSGSGNRGGSPELTTTETLDVRK